jgi:uncharacterized protein YegL
MTYYNDPMESELIKISPAQNGLVPCAVRLVAPDTVQRVPTHFILLLDVSESMMDDNKLENVKKCSSLIVNLLSEQDRLSLITFGDTSTIVLREVKTDAAQKDAICERIRSLSCDGCTNLSAGLADVNEIVESNTLKTGLLILTDGHANRGTSNPTQLREIVKHMNTRFPALSIHSVGYGVQHNEELLRGIAQDVAGSYNIVNSVEDTAFAFGDTLGGLMSCAFQNVRINVPAGSVVKSAHNIRFGGAQGNGLITIGDVYSGTKPLVLVDIPESAVDVPGSVSVQGVNLPSMETWIMSPIASVLVGRNIDIEVASLRIDCVRILDLLKRWSSLTVNEKEDAEKRLGEFATAVADTFLDTHPVSIVLRDEVVTLRRMLEQAKNNRLTAEESVMASQHIATISMARGYNSPMSVRRPLAGRRRRRGTFEAVTTEVEENPVAPASEANQTAFMNSTQANMATLLRRATQNIEE